VSATAGQAQEQRDLAGRLGIKPGQVVQEIGYDDDVDEELRDAIAGDLVDALVDALTPLADGGYIWLLTPKAGREGHVEPSEIGEAAPTAGLSQTSSVSAARDWSGSRLVAPKARR
jgi:hypothetical protein